MDRTASFKARANFSEILTEAKRATAALRQLREESSRTTRQTDADSRSSARTAQASSSAMTRAARAASEAARQTAAAGRQAATAGDGYKRAATTASSSTTAFTNAASKISAAAKRTQDGAAAVSRAGDGYRRASQAASASAPAFVAAASRIAEAARRASASSATAARSGDGYRAAARAATTAATQLNAASSSAARAGTGWNAAAFSAAGAATRMRAAGTQARSSGDSAAASGSRAAQGGPGWRNLGDAAAAGSDRARGAGRAARDAGDAAASSGGRAAQGAGGWGRIYSTLSLAGGAFLSIPGGAAAAAASIGAVALGAIKMGLSFNATKEQSTIAFTSILKDGGKAQDLMARIVDTARSTPFETETLVQGVRQMLSFGIPLEQVLKGGGKEAKGLVITMGDAVAAMGGGAEMMSGVIRAVGQMNAKGKVGGEEMLQLAENGIPVFEILKEELGLTAEQVSNIGKQGISAEKGISALQRGLDKRFGGSMEKQASTLLGIMSTLKDNVVIGLGKATEGLFNTMKPKLQALGDILTELNVAAEKKGFMQAIADKWPAAAKVIDKGKEIFNSAKDAIAAAWPIAKQFATQLGTLGAMGGWAGLSALSTILRVVADVLNMIPEDARGTIGALIGILVAARSLKNMFGGLKDALGSKLFGDAESGATNLSKTMTAMGDAFKGATSNMGEAPKVIEATAYASSRAQRVIDKVAGAIGGTAASIGAGFEKAGDKIQDWGGRLENYVSDLPDKIGRGLDAAKQGLSNFSSSVKDSFSSAAEWVKGKADEMGDIPDKLGQVWDKAKDALKNAPAAIGGAWDSVQEKAGEMVDGVQEHLGNFGAAFKEGFTRARDALRSGADAVRSGSGRIASGLASLRTSATNAISGTTAAIRNFPTAVGNAARGAATAVQGAATRMAASGRSMVTAMAVAARGTATAIVGIPRALGQAVTSAGTAVRNLGTTVTGGIANALRGIPAAMGTAAGAMSRFTILAGGVGTAAVAGLRGIGAGLMGALGGPWGAIIMAAGIALQIFMAKQQAAKQAALEHEGAIQSLKGTLQEYTGTVQDATVAERAKDLSSKKLADGTTSILDAVQKAGISMEDFTQASLGNQTALAKVNSQLLVSAKNLPALNTLYGEMKGELDKGGVSLDTFSQAALGNSDAIKKVADAMNMSEGVVEKLLKTAGGGLSELGVMLDGYGSDLNQATKQTQDAALAANAFGIELSKTADIMRGFDKANVDATGNIDAAASGASELSGQLTSMALAAQGSAQAAGRVAAANGTVADGAQAAAKYVEEARLKFIDQAKAIGYSDEQAQGLANSMGLIPSAAQINFSTNADAVTGQLNIVKDIFGAIPGAKEIRIAALTSDAAAALEQLGFKVVKLEDGTFKVIADTHEAILKLDEFRRMTEGLIAIAQIDADAAKGTQKGKDLKAAIDAATAILTIDANPQPGTQQARDLQKYIDDITAIMTADADSRPGTRKGDDLKRYVDGLRALLTVGANTDPAEAALDQVIRIYNGKKITLRTEIAKIPGIGQIVGNANGGFYEAFAQGGTRRKDRPHTAQIAQGAGPVRVWAEPETGGEAYLPLGASKRKGALGVLDRVLSRFGMPPSDVIKAVGAQAYANGGAPTPRPATKRAPPAASPAKTGAGATLPTIPPDAASRATELQSAMSKLNPIATATTAAITGIVTKTKELAASGLQPLATQLNTVLIPALQKAQASAGTATVQALAVLKGALPPLEGSIRATASTAQSAWQATASGVAAAVSGQTGQFNTLKTGLSTVDSAQEQSKARASAAWSSMQSATQAATAGQLGQHSILKASLVAVNAANNTAAATTGQTWQRNQQAVAVSVGGQKQALQGLNQGLGATKQVADLTATGFSGAFGRMREGAAGPVRSVIQGPFNAGLIQAWNKVNSFFALGRAMPTIPAGFKEGGDISKGGALRGGRAGKDSIPLYGMPGEFMFSEEAVDRAGGPAVMEAWHKALRSNNKLGPGYEMFGGDPSQPGLLMNKRVRGYAEGGPVTPATVPRAMAFAKSQSGKPYQWGGVGNPSYDCSGFMSAIQNVLLGKSPNSRLYTTASFAGGRGAAGMIPGLKSLFGVGVSTNTGSGIGHMAGTLAGMNVESAGGGKGVNAGGSARGARDGLFPMQFSLPQAGGIFIGGGGDFDVAGFLKKQFDPARAMTNGFPGSAYPGAAGKGEALQGIAGGEKFARTLIGFANGGMREDHKPQMRRGGDLRLWAEPETGGEAYLPLGQQKRRGALGVLDKVLAKFGLPDIKMLERLKAKFMASGAYRVVAGDTLSSIARRENTTWQILYDLNRDILNDPNKIYPGQYIKTPATKDYIRAEDKSLVNPGFYSKPALPNAAIQQSKSGDALTLDYHGLPASSDIGQIYSAANSAKQEQARAIGEKRAEASGVEGARAEDYMPDATLSWNDFTQAVEHSRSALETFNQDLIKIGNIAGPEVVAQLRAMGEEGVNLARQMAQQSTPAIKDAATAMKLLSDVSKQTLAEYVLQLNGASKETDEFNKKVMELASRGYTDLAQNLLEVGAENGSVLADQALASNSAAAAANSAVKSSGATQTAHTAEVITLLGALRNAQGVPGLRAIAQVTGFTDYFVADLVNEAKAQVEQTGKGAQLIKDVSAFKAGTYYFASGGMYPQIAGAGAATRVWNERSAGGEAFISLAASMRGRSRDIWSQVGSQLGMPSIQELVNGIYSQIYTEVQAARATATTAATSTGDTSIGGNTYIFNTHVYNPVAEKSSDSVNRVVTNKVQLGALAGGKR